MVLRLVFLRTALHSSDYSLNAAKAVIAMQCVMHYTTMSASFSYLMPFLAAFDSNLGASTKLDTMVATRSSERRDNTAGSSGHWRAVEQKAPGIRQDGGSMQQRPREDSVDSKAPIIVKTTSYRVEVGE